MSTIPPPIRVTGPLLVLLPALMILNAADIRPAVGAESGQTTAPGRPNVIVIITDDQGYGDLSLHGNPILKTPRLDQLAREGTRLEAFHVSPVCSPTRSSLMTGRYNYRTGVVDTYIGRSMMHADEVTLAERLRAAGYDTGIVGKWHLGDNYPLRPQDQGFRYTYVHKGGGITQPSGPPDDSYFDPIVYENGVKTKTKGYCTDIFTDAAIRFLSQTRAGNVPFFLYVAYNAPHGPHQVPDADLNPYRNADFRADRLPVPPGGSPVSGAVDGLSVAKTYGMVANIDKNVGRLMDKLKSSGLDENTLVVFLTDNGPDGPRYNAGMRGRKGTVFEGGIRVPCFWRFPKVIPANRTNDTLSAHIDVHPTILDACGVTAPAAPAPALPAVDGVSLWSRIRGQVPSPAQGGPPLDRTLFFQWHRGDIPQLYEGFAAITPRYKLCQPLHGNGMPDTAPLLLFDRSNDPGEKTNLAPLLPEVAAELKTAYENWFKNVAATRNFAGPNILIGHELEPTGMLTRQDWRGPDAGWNDTSNGYWDVEVVRPATYKLTFLFRAPKRDARLTFQFQNVVRVLELARGQTQAVIADVPLPEGPGKIVAEIQEGASVRGVHFVGFQTPGQP